MLTLNAASYVSVIDLYQKSCGSNIFFSNKALKPKCKFETVSCQQCCDGLKFISIIQQIFIAIAVLGIYIYI